MPSVAEIILRMSLDGKGVTRGANDVGKALDSISKKAGNFAAGLLGGTALMNKSRQVIEHAGQVADLSKQYNLTTDAVQEFTFAAEESGASIEDVGAAIKKLRLAQVEALSGDAGKRDSFARLGVSLDDLKKKDPEALFRQVTRAVKDMADSSQLTADMVDVLGKSSDKLLPAIRDGFTEAAASAKDLGQVIDKEIVGELDNLGDTLQQTGKSIMVGLSYPLAWLGRRITDIVASAKGLGAMFGTLSASQTGFTDFLKAPFSADAREKISGEWNTAKAAGEAAALSVYEKETEARMGGGKRPTLAGELATVVDSKVKEKKVREEKAREVSLGKTIEADSLARLGLFRGGGIDQMKILQERQLYTLRALLSEQRRLNNMVERENG